MKKEKVLALALAGAVGATAAVGISSPSYAGMMDSLGGGLLGGGKKEEKAAPANVEGDIASMLKDLSSASSIEQRGRRMIVSARIAMANAETIVSSAEFSASLIKGGIAQLGKGADELQDQTADLYLKLAAVRASQKDSIASMVKVRDKGSEDFEEESDEMEEDGALDLSGSSVYVSEYEDRQETVNDAVGAFNEKHAALSGASADTKAAFLEKIVFPTSATLYGAKKAIEVSLGNFPKIEASLDRIDKEASEAGKEIVAEGVKMVATLALQHEKITNLITELQSDPIGNLDNINKLKDILSRVTFFIDIIKSHNAKIETVNGILANFIGVINQSEPLFRAASRDASQVIAALENAVEKIVAVKN